MEVVGAGKEVVGVVKVVVVLGAAKKGEWGGAAGALLGSCRTITSKTAQRHPWKWPPGPKGQCEAATTLSRLKV